MQPIKILIVDDEAEIRRFLEAALHNQNHVIESVETGNDALRLINAKVPDIIILDLGLPDMDGKDVIKSIREWSRVPIIVLSARDKEQEKIDALELGADDYLTKPFGTGELLARLKVALRHINHGKTVQGTYTYLGLQIDLDKRKVTLEGADINLTPTEYKLLASLARDPGKVLTQNQLINEVWGKNSQGNSQYLRIYVQHLRQKLKDNPLEPRFILTEAGIGYRLNFKTDP